VKRETDIAKFLITFVDYAISFYITLVVPNYATFDAFVGFFANFICLMVGEALLIKESFVAINAAKSW
jgi:hypothetical protein